MAEYLGVSHLEDIWRLALNATTCVDSHVYGEANNAIDKIFAYVSNIVVLYCGRLSLHCLDASRIL